MNPAMIEVSIILSIIFVVLFLVAAARAFVSERFRALNPVLTTRILQLENELAVDNRRHREKIELLEDKLLVKAGYGHLQSFPIQSQEQQPGRHIVPVSEVVARARSGDVVQMKVPPAVPPAVLGSFRKEIRSAAVPARRK